MVACCEPLRRRMAAKMPPPPPSDAQALAIPWTTSAGEDPPARIAAESLSRSRWNPLLRTAQEVGKAFPRGEIWAWIRDRLGPAPRLGMRQGRSTAGFCYSPRKAQAVQAKRRVQRSAEPQPRLPLPARSSQAQNPPTARWGILLLYYELCFVFAKHLLRCAASGRGRSFCLHHSQKLCVSRRYLHIRRPLRWLKRRAANPNFR
jgi:hypothetical protein